MADEAVAVLADPASEKLTVTGPALPADSLQRLVEALTNNQTLRRIEFLALYEMDLQAKRFLFQALGAHRALIAIDVRWWNIGNEGCPTRWKSCGFGW